MTQEKGSLVGAGISVHTDHAHLEYAMARRAVCLQIALTLLAGRSVHMAIVLDIAKWIYGGEEH